MKTEYARVEYQNPDATEGLKLNLQIISNTAETELQDNIRNNTRKYKNWLQYQEPHKRIAIMIGGGDSINDHIEDIKSLQSQAGVVFALNGASKWARDHGIYVDYQVIVDAKEETSELVDPGAENHLFASQCNPKTLEKAHNLTLWHLDIGDVEKYFPEERVKQGGYVLVGGDSTVGVCALCAAYTQGFRDMHVFGYDSSYRNGKSHGYPQDINNTMPTMEVEWGGKTFQVSVAMKSQAEKFGIYAQALKADGCEFHVYGDGYLQTIYNTSVENLSEQEKYKLMWLFDGYRESSPGERISEFYLNEFKPEGRIIDYGCGTGRASIKFLEYGLEPLLLDFADNCRDKEAQELPFIVQDLTNPIPYHAENGFCADVMEHIPTEDVQKVIENIMRSADKVFFQISTVDDSMGELINEPLHLTVKDHDWWLNLFSDYDVIMDKDMSICSLFYVSQPRS